MRDIEKMVERTFKILQCSRHNIFKTFLSIKDHTIFDHKISNDFYRALKKAVSKKFWQLFRSKKR